MSRSEIKYSLCEFNQRYLFPMEREFLPRLKEWRNSQIQVLRQTRPLTDYDQEKWFQRLSEDTHQAIFAIMIPVEECEGMKLIGYCGITSIDYKSARGELSFLVDPDRASDEELYRKDFLSVLSMLCKYGFEELNLNKIYTETFSFRGRTIVILEEFGFHLDGILREHHFTSGQYYDSLIHSILLSEWKLRQEEIKNAVEK